MQEFIRTYTPVISRGISQEPRLGPRGDNTEGTGQWFFNVSEFQNWVNSDNGLLFINGLGE